MSDVLVFRTGSLGDTIVALPALWTLREHFAGSRLVLLSDRHAGKTYVLANDLLRDSGIVDEFLEYVVDYSPWARALTPLRMAALAARLRRRRFETLVYLVPSNRTPHQVRRDRWFFRLAGIRRLLAMDSFPELPAAGAPGPHAALPKESDLLLDRLAASGISLSPSSRIRSDLGLGPADEAIVDAWRAGLPADGGRPWIAIAPGSKMPLKKWPLERYSQVVSRLIESFDVWPVIVGGAEDAAEGRSLLGEFGRGYNAAGTVGLRPSAAVIARCRLYLGNDTGSMHMAASAGVRCVAIFSARAAAGWWEPRGEGHAVLRVAIDCEGCQLYECVERRMECILRIGVAEVQSACERILRDVLDPGAGSHVRKEP